MAGTIETISEVQSRAPTAPEGSGTLYAADGNEWHPITGGGGGVEDFLSLVDVFETQYIGNEGLSVVVNSAGDGLVFDQLTISHIENLQSSLDLKADKSNVIEKNSTTPYSPTSDYNPTTKKYVDDGLIEKLPTQTHWEEAPVLSVNLSDNTKFDISSGIGVITDYTDPVNPIITLVAFSSQSGVTPTYLNTNPSTSIIVDSLGNIVQTPISPTPSQRRQYLSVGTVLHANQTTVNDVQGLAILGYETVQTIKDMADAMGTINTYGNVFSPNGTNLQIKKTVGEVFRLFSNYDVDPNKPHSPTSAAQTPVTSFFRGYRDGAGGWVYDTQTAITPDVYDNGSGTLATVLPNNYTIQKIYHYAKTGISIVQTGQTVYSTLADAKIGLHDSFERDPDIETSALRCYLIVMRGTTDLTDTTDAVFYTADKFGHI